MSDRGCCAENHRAERLGAYSGFEVWQNARTGDAEIFVRQEDYPDQLGEIPQEAIEMAEQGNRQMEDLRDARMREIRRIVGVIILITWLILACTTTTLLAALTVLRLS